MEYFDVVDDEDNVVGRASRKQCHEKKLLHRSVQFFIFDKDGRILVNKRSSTKEFFEGQWSIVLGGHVPSGETYDDAVSREALEEADVETKPFYMGSFKKRIPEEKENVRVYGFLADGKVELLADEIEHGEFMDRKQMMQTIQTEEFIPETTQLLEILGEYLKEDGDAARIKT